MGKDATYFPNYSGQLSSGCNSYCMLEGPTVIRFHQVKTDQTWNYMRKATFKLHILNSSGLSTRTLGDFFAKGQPEPVVVVPAGSYLSVELINKGDYGLCTVSSFPGVSTLEYEPMDPLELSSKFPAHRDLIMR